MLYTYTLLIPMTLNVGVLMNKLSRNHYLKSLDKCCHIYYVDSNDIKCRCPLMNKL